MIYAVIDTNVFVSAYLTHNPQSATSKIVAHLLQGDITLLYNDEILAEYNEVLSRKHFHISAIERDSLLDYIITYGIRTERTPFNELFTDEDDRIFYEVSLSEGESFLITGNIKHYPTDPKVVTPAQMVEILKKTFR